MKNLKPHFIVFLIAFFVFSAGLTSCVVHEHHRPHRHKTVIIKEKRIPPGHRKEKHRHHDHGRHHND